MASCPLNILLLGSFVLTILSFPVRNVLGAGDAGITAAVSFVSIEDLSLMQHQQSLTNISVQDFFIAEYNSEIGGRCRHAVFGKDGQGNPYTFELGAD